MMSGHICAWCDEPEKLSDPLVPVSDTEGRDSERGDIVFVHDSCALAHREVEIQERHRERDK